MEHVKISLVKPNPENPRYITDDKMEKLVQSIKDFPEMLELRPLVVDSDMVFLGGNMRLLACKIAGLKSVPIIRAENLTEEQKREFVVKDNVGFGQWDWDALGNLYDVVELNDWGLDVPNIEPIEVKKAEEDYYENPDDMKIDVVLGDVIQIGPHRLVCGDSTNPDDLDKLLKDERADMVFTDPPWNVNYGAVKEDNPMGYKPRTIMNDHMSTEDFKDFMGSAFSMMAMYSKKGTPTYVVMSPQEWGNLMLALFENDYHWSSTIIWNKSHLVMSRKDYHTKYEPIWYGWLEGAPRLCPLEDRTQSDVWDVDRPTRSELHPTTKPIELVAKAIQNSSKPGNLVLDLFLGSGSTMVASHQTDRKCYGMELDPKYAQTIVNRMMKLDPDLNVTINGKTYNNGKKESNAK